MDPWPKGHFFEPQYPMFNFPHLLAVKWFHYCKPTLPLLIIAKLLICGGELLPTLKFDADFLPEDWNEKRALTVAQLAERSLPTAEVCGLNPVIGKFLYRTFIYCQMYWKDENKEKEAGQGPFKKIWNEKESEAWDRQEVNWEEMCTHQCLNK